MKMRGKIAAATLGIISMFGLVAIAEANHSWGGYHWARTSNPFTIQLGDNLSANWKPFLVTTSADWSLSSVLDTVITTGRSTIKTCKPTAGRVEVCNAKYGNNGWLGIAQIWLSGSHITQGTTKLNDTYFTTPRYNTVAWKNLVMCQEVGHTFGLAHQDENFDNPNLGTCMDYTNDPTTNQHPNAHDYAELEEIYAHLDTTTTIGQSTSSSAATEEDSNDPKAWGKEVYRSADGLSSVFEQDLGNGRKTLRDVFWAEPRGNDKK